MEDIKMTKVRHRYDEEDTRDTHLDFDMFDFIYSLVSTVSAWEASLSPLDHPLTKFDKPHINIRHKYDEMGNKIKVTDETSNEHPRVVGDGNNAIILYSDKEEHFDDIKKVCEIYKFQYEGPIRHTSLNYYWEWSFKIYVPMMGENYPMLIEDYFNDIGIALEDVMHQRWVVQYRSKMAKLQKEADKEYNEKKLEKLYNNAVVGAWRDGTVSLDTHYNNLIETLENEGVTYKKTLLRKKFMAEFADDAYEEKASVTELFA